MKRYLLFGGECYYLDGGWDDLISDGDSVSHLKAVLEKEEQRIEWAHIIDSHDGSKVWSLSD